MKRRCWSCKNTFWLCLLLFVTIYSCDGSGFNQNQHPPNTYYGITRESATFKWGYTIDPGHELLSLKCGYWENAVLVEIAYYSRQNKGLTPLTPLADKLLEGRVDVDEHRKAVIIKDLKFTDERVLACLLFYSTGGTQSFSSLSSNSSLIVNGSPEICESPNRQHNVTEGAQLTLDVVICANPKPSVVWRYGDVTSRIPGDEVKSIKKHTYRVSYLTQALTKDICGTKITCFASNQYQQNTTSTTVYMKFAPDAPEEPMAYYTNKECVEVEWKKPNIGQCLQSYYFDYYIESRLHARKELLDSSATTYTTCFNDTGNENITSVNTIAFTSLGEMNMSASVASSPPTTPAPLSKGSSKVFVILGCVLAIIIITLLVATYCYWKKKRENHTAPHTNGSVHTKRKDNGDEPEAKLVKQPTEVIYAEAQKGPVVYCELGSGGGRNPQQDALNQPSDYCQVKTAEEADDELDAMVPPRRRGHRT